MHLLAPLAHSFANRLASAMADQQPPAVPQLAQAMGRAGCVLMPAIEEFCEFMPGVPFSNLLLDEFLKDYKNNCFCINFTHENMQFHVRLGRTGRESGKGANRQTIWRIDCVIEVKFVDEPDNRETDVNKLRKFTGVYEDTRAGLRKLLQEMQAIVNEIKLRGLCQRCLAEERPRKRLRLRATGACVECTVNDALRR